MDPARRLRPGAWLLQRSWRHPQRLPAGWRSERSRARRERGASLAHPPSGPTVKAVPGAVSPHPTAARTSCAASRGLAFGAVPGPPPDSPGGRERAYPRAMPQEQPATISETEFALVADHASIGLIRFDASLPRPSRQPGRPPRPRAAARQPPRQVAHGHLRRPPPGGAGARCGGRGGRLAGARAGRPRQHHRAGPPGSRRGRLGDPRGRHRAAAPAAHPQRVHRQPLATSCARPSPTCGS